MSSTVDFLEYVCEQIRGGYEVRYRKMFGDYMVYVNDKPIFLVCDNCVYVKKIVELAELMKDAECGIPYDGAKEHYILDVEDSELMDKVVDITEKAIPLPKKKVKKMN